MKKFYLLTILCALLGVSQAWGETCIVYEHEAEESVKTNSGNTAIFTTPDLGNTDGIDTIRFEYKMSSSLAKKMKVRYSTDGTSFVDFSGGDKTCKDKWRGRTGEDKTDIYVIVPESLRTSIKKVQFAVYEGSTFSYTYYVRKIQISKAPTLKLDKSSDAFPKIAVGANTSKTYTVSTWNVSSDINVGISGDNASLFSYELSDPSGSCPTERTLTITYSPDEASELHSARVTVSADNTGSATLDVTASADAEVDPVYTCNIADKYFVEDDELDLATLWTSTSTGAITYTIVSFEAASGDQEGATAPAIRENRYLSLGEAGILNLKLSQVEKGAYGEGEDTKTVTIARRTPEFTWYAGDVYYNTTIENFCVSNQSDTEFTLTSSDDQIASVSGTTVTTFNKPGKVTFTASQVGNYKWAEKNDVKEVTLSKKVNHVPFEMNNADVRDLLYVGVSSDGTIYCEDDGRIVLTQGGAAWTSNELYYIIRFDGIPDQLSYTYRSTNNIATSYGRGDAFVVYESATGADDSWTEVDGSKKEVPGDTDDHNVDPLSLKSTTRYLKFYFHATYTGNFKNIKVTELKQFDAEDVNFGDIEINSEVAEKTLTFKHANAGYNVSVKLEEEGETKFFAIDHTAVANTGGDKMGEENFKVTFNPSVVGSHTATVTFSDQIGHSKVVTLSANVLKITPTIDEQPAASEITYGQMLSESELTGGVVKDGEDDVDGSFSWADGTELLDAGIHEKEVVFTPTNTDVYEQVRFSVDVKINQKEIEILDVDKDTVYLMEGDALNDDILKEITSALAKIFVDVQEWLSGIFTWTSSQTEAKQEDEEYEVTFTPDDTNYAAAPAKVRVKVAPKVPTAVINLEDGKTSVKILRDGQVLILRDGKVYNLNGLEVR